MKGKYLTIEREYGSGGTQIANILSEKTGIPCYGREILEAMAAKYDISVEYIENYEETVTNSFLYTIYAMNRSYSGDPDMLSREGHLFIAEQEEIRDIAKKGKAIFLGHCACEALKGEQGLVKSFIRCSDAEEKRRRITEEYGIPAADAEKTRRRFDKKRANYFYANTASKWNDYENYDIVLDSAKLGIEGCVGTLCDLLA